MLFVSILEHDFVAAEILNLQDRSTKRNSKNLRQDQLNMMDKEADLDKKKAMLQEELRALSELEEDRKTDEDKKREDLLLEELIECIKKSNELVSTGIKMIRY